MYSKKMSRQIKKAFGNENLDEVIANAEKTLHNLGSADLEPLKVLLQVKQLVDSVNRSYIEYEDRFSVASRNIDLSSAELSQMNNRLAKINESINTMINSLGEGYFLVNSNGICEGIYSKICEEIFCGSPSGMPLSALLNLDESEVETFNQWIFFIFSGQLSLEDISDLGPKSFNNKKNQTFGLSFRLIKSEEKIHNLVVVASDKTAEIQANANAQDKVLEAKTIVKLVEDKEQFQLFFRMIKETLSFMRSPSHNCAWDQLSFDLHTIKGGASTFYMKSLENCLQDYELQIKSARDQNRAPEISQLEIANEIEKQVDEFVSRFQRVLGEKESWLNQIVFDRQGFLDLVFQKRSESVPQQLVEDVLSHVMGIELKSLFSNFRSTVQISAARLNKSIGPLQIEGKSLRLPQEPYRKLFSSLVHLFRNAVDHGIECEEERLQHGKPLVGTIKVRFGLSNNQKSWWFEVEDDGAGIDCEALRQKLIAKEGPQVASLSDSEIMNGLLKFSISSKSSADQTSGMGVGLGAIGKSVEDLGGSYMVTSQKQKGTTIRFEIPLVQWRDIIKHPPQAA